MLENQIPPMPVLIKDLGYIYPKETSKQKRRYGIYKCSCGNNFKAMSDNINNKKSKSCGCYCMKRAIETNTTHRLSYHRLYSTWKGMISRTSDNNRNNFSYYGGRGIIVCERWLDINNFIEDMYPTFKEGLSIDRINNDGNYEPSNCRWANQSTQLMNTRQIHTNNTSGYRGVHYHKRNKKWVSSICINGNKKHLGCFSDPKCAAKAYDTYVIEHNLEHTINGV